MVGIVFLWPRPGTPVLRRSNVTRVVLAPVLIMLGINSFVFHLTLWVHSGTVDTLLLRTTLWLLQVRRRVFYVQSLLYFCVTLDAFWFVFLPDYAHALLLMPANAIVYWKRKHLWLYVRFVLACIGWGVSEIFWHDIPWIGYLELLGVFHVTAAWTVYKLLS